MYILKKLAKNEYNSTEVLRLLECLPDDSVIKLLDDSYKDNSFNNRWYDDILTNFKVVSLPFEKRKKYIKAFLNSVGYIGRIFYLYELANTDEEKEYIRENVPQILKDDPNVLDDFVSCQLSYEIYLIPTSELEKMAIKNEDYSSLYYLMKYKDANKHKILNELGKQKEKSLEAKNLFLDAINEYAPEVLAKIPFGLYASEVNSLNISHRGKMDIIDDALDALVKLDLANKEDGDNDDFKTKNHYKDENASSFVRPPEAYTKARPIKMGPRGADHF